MQDIGLLEHADAWHLRGWAIRSTKDLAAELILIVDGQPHAIFRPQWAIPSISQRLQLPKQLWIGFQIDLPRFVANGKSHRVEIRFAHNHQLLERGQRTVRRSPLPSPLIKANSSQRLRQTPQVSVIVLNRNGAAVLDELLTSWQQYNRTVPVEWVVIDHDSTDESLQVVRNWQKQLNLKLKALKHNDSFSASCNLGAQLATSPLLLFLNNDLIWQQDALPEMMKTLAEANVVAVGLKLLKLTDIASPSGPSPWTEIQHLGIRFCPHASGYAPFEATPYNSHRELVFSSQAVAGVTGAALLCRKTDFFRVGGFNTDYFYGFEDVEFCLRLSHQLKGRIVCRNDLVALHRHGHTRLTGRESSISDRLVKNERTLQHQLGLWLKKTWWHSLLASDHVVCTEQLTIAVWTGLPTLTGPKPYPGLMRWVKQMAQQLPNARVWLVDQSLQDMDWREVHVLISPDPLLDPGQLNHRRPDLRAFGWVSRRSHAFLHSLSAWPGYDHLVHVDAPNPLASNPLALTDFTPDWLMQSLRWRAVVVMMGAFAPENDHQPLLVAAHKLVQSLQQAGHSCIALWESEWVLPRSLSRKMVDICVVVTSGQLPAWLEPANLNVVWHLGTGTPPDMAEPEYIAPDCVLKRQPSAPQLSRLLERRLGHTFSAS